MEFQVSNYVQYHIFFQYFTICLFLTTVLATQPHYQHEQLLRKDRLPQSHVFARSLNTTGQNLTSNDPQELIKQALAAISIANKARLDQPYFNKLEFANSSTLRKGASIAPPLDYTSSVAKNGTKRRALNTTSEDNARRSYSIPPEVVKAARLLAESTSQETSGDQPEVAAQIRRKYALKVNDTNHPPQHLIRPNGLLGYEPFAIQEVIGNETANRLEQRAPSGSSYWMANLQQRGLSPFAPQGYKVWRNVKDYGAKGDGVTDDTAAIQLAISDGGRCGANCGSSTIVPAVIWFPGGTYLISTPLIQYYNTQFLGDPLNVPTLLGARSFVGSGIIISDVYINDKDEWYINTNNFLRSIKNFKIDIRNTDTGAYICGIRWQVAQAASLENIEFYMLYNTDVPSNTQQGIFMENGSGGFLADLTFVGGNFGAYFGNQQFTTSQLVFVSCATALQVHWDWAWTMQDFVIESCQRGLVIVGGAGGPGSTGQSVGSVILVDAIVANTPKGVVTSLYKENSTSLLLQNVGFFNVKDAVLDDITQKPLLAGGNEVLVDSWGFGLLKSSSGNSTFVNGAYIPAMNRTAKLLGSQAYVKQNLFTRRRPKYDNIGMSQIIDVKSLGAKGDGVSDDTVALNNILSMAANMSSIVFFPFGVYLVTDTVHIPVGSRIIGQAWSQIMGTGSKFQDARHPYPVAKAGNVGDVGILEIQDMMFTVSGPTSGAIILQWNIQESSQGSAGLWDTHIRVGGAIGSKLQNEQCPKLSGTVNPNCIAASMLLHLTPQSTGYLENVWVWVADHDLDKITQDQIDIYAGRGILVESQLAWLYGTSSEHSVLYQYQISGAKNILMAMIQTESPYFQPTPRAPAPFITGIFSNDPGFENCTQSSLTCASSWALRVIDSSTVYILGSGLYSWFNKYSQDCLKTENCQDRSFEIEQSFDIWIYNLCTKAIVEMVSPKNSIATYARDNVNGFLSSILAWVEGANKTTGGRIFEGFSLYTLPGLSDLDLPTSCQSALTQTIKCERYISKFEEPTYRGPISNTTLRNSICDESCGQSLKTWFDSVRISCEGYQITGALPTIIGGRIWAAYNETCLVDKTTGVNCNDQIVGFPRVGKIEDMPQSQICSFCYVERLEMMRRTPYSIYDQFYKSRLEYVHSRCGLTGSTDIPISPITPDPPEESLCVSGNSYTAKGGDTCNSVAVANSISSAALFMANSLSIHNCSIIPAGATLCLPLSCSQTYVFNANESCATIENNAGGAYNLTNGDIRKYNPWISFNCENLQDVVPIYGSTLCLSPQNGVHNHTGPSSGGDTTIPNPSTGYSEVAVPPPANSSVAEGTTMVCGKWHVMVEGEQCADICIQEKIPADLFRLVNPSLKTGDCSAALIIGRAYCVGPTYEWNNTETTSTSVSSTSKSTTSSSSATATPSIASYHLDPTDDYSGAKFFDFWYFRATDDLEHGYVDYQTRAQAEAKAMIGYNAEKARAFVGVDNTNVIAASARGRPSIRLESRKSYTKGMFVANLTHMPEPACGIWPSFWTVDWAKPASGKIDILTNVNEQTVPLNSLRTTAGCTIAAGTVMTDTIDTTNCNSTASATNNGGCIARNTASGAYGSAFNARGGGVVVMEWTTRFIKMWNFAPNAVPQSLTNGKPDADTFGTPAFTTGTGSCVIDNHFLSHQITINTGFCGDFAGKDSVWQQTTCYKNNPTKYKACKDYVAANPTAYANAYWIINSVKVFKWY